MSETEVESNPPGYLELIPVLEVVFFKDASW